MNKNTNVFSKNDKRVSLLRYKMIFFLTYLFNNLPKVYLWIFFFMKCQCLYFCLGGTFFQNFFDTNFTAFDTSPTSLTDNVPTFLNWKQDRNKVEEFAVWRIRSFSIWGARNHCFLAFPIAPGCSRFHEKNESNWAVFSI